MNNTSDPAFKHSPNPAKSTSPHENRVIPLCMMIPSRSSVKPNTRCQDLQALSTENPVALENNLVVEMQLVAKTKQLMTTMTMILQK
jgi:hypothetical protein